jgi:hypothetical protein
MGAAQIQDPLAGEELLAIAPNLSQQTEARWLQRLSLFTGRTLSDTALTNEQRYRAGRLAVLGQAVTPGTVQGLDLSVDIPASDPILTVSPGYGIAATGQDVTLLRQIRTKLSGLAVLDGQSGSFLADFSNYVPPAGQPWAGVFLLQAIVANVAGSEVDTGSTNIVVSGNLDTSCDQDPSELAFGDSQIVDGARLVMMTWPSSPASLAMPAALPAASWRNRLVYTIFNAELALAPDQRLPWEFSGVPLALAGFDATSKLLFADRSAVVRTGGLSRRRYVIPSQDTAGFQVVEPALANARVNQLAEQLGDILTPSSVEGLIANQFALLPPAGVLPFYTMDFAHQMALWCPQNWSVTVAPVYAEELEGILLAGITAAPFDTTQNENIEILVPLPDAVYDPSILLVEQVDPVFQQEVNAAALARNVVLQHRNIIELEANALAPVLNQTKVDLNAGLTDDEILGRDGSPVFTPDPAESFNTSAVTVAPDGTTVGVVTYLSADVASLKATALGSPYLFTSGNTVVRLFSDDDLNDIDLHGLQHFIDLINAKLDKANDLLDLAFLTAQTDIYRYRQNVLGTTDASRLAVSPILANIASGDTAAATAQNIQDYLTSLNSSDSASISKSATAAGAPLSTATPPKAAVPGLASSLSARAVSPAPPPATVIKKETLPAAGLTVAKTGVIFTNALNAAAFVPRQFTGGGESASPIDITQESPIVGQQLNLRTLTIASRLTMSAPQEAYLYSVGNRLAMIKLLALLEITIDDLPIALDLLPSEVPVPPYTMADLRPSAPSGTPGAPSRKDVLLGKLTTPDLASPSLSTTGSNPDSAGLFSAGIIVLEEHTALLRLVEGRIQLYRDFLSLCAAKLAAVQAAMQSAQILLAQLESDLTQSRQNLAFVSSLLADEQARVTQVNTTRLNILQTSVQFVAYTRPRTLVDTAATPSRQLLPANVASPVPACLKQSVAIPPELRELVALLREAPVYWFPSMQVQLPKLERPALLLDLATDTRTRAAVQLQSTLHTSSAESAAGLFSSSIAGVYATGQQTLRSYQTQRAAFDPAQLANQSWVTQVGTLQSIVAVADLMSSASVHAEISNSASRWLQQVSSVATCLYTRVGSALPINRLEWAEFLRDQDVSVNLRSLAVLPGWNSQNYIDRQQMQLLVDWLFQQVDATNATATALMNDVISVAILLASNAPVDNIIAGAIAIRTPAVLDGYIRLTLPSDRVAHGMNVQLYSGGDLAAMALVSDLDGAGVTAAITDVYKPNAVFQPNDVAHFTGLERNAVLYKAFSA